MLEPSNLRRYRNPSVVTAIAVACLLGAFYLWHGSLAGVLWVGLAASVAGAAFTWLAVGASPTPTTRRAHTVRTAVASLVAAWAGAAAIVCFERPGEFDLQRYFVTITTVGGLLAVIRSAATGSGTQAVLGEVLQIADELRALGRERRAGSDLALLVRAATAAPDMDRCLRAMRSIVSALTRHPALGDNADAVSLWVRDDARSSWAVLVAEGMGDASRDDFTQPILAQETPGAGFVANLAVTGDDVFLCESGATTHRWFRPDPQSDRTPMAFAAVLLRDSAGEPIGALCVTSEARDAFSVQFDGSGESLEILLKGWGIWLSFALERLLALTRQG